MKTTLNSFFLIIFLLKLVYTNAQTLSTSEAEGVYGGQILDIESWSFDPESVYVVISTESPNSLFVAKALRNPNRNDLSFSVLPSAGSDDGYGDNVENIEVHEFSNTLYFLVNSSVYKTDLTSSSATLVDQLVKNFIIKGDTMCLVKNNLVAGGLDTLVLGL